MSIHTKILLDPTFSGFLGAVCGLGLGVGMGYLSATTHPYNKALGSQDSQALALGYSVIGIIAIGTILGCAVGTGIALVISKRSAARNPK